MIEHIVLLKLKDGVSEDKMKALLAGLNDLKKVIPGMLEVSGGYNNSPEGKAAGFNYGFIVKNSKLVIDTRNAARNVKKGWEKIVRA